MKIWVPYFCSYSFEYEYTLGWIIPKAGSETNVKHFVSEVIFVGYVFFC